MTKIQWTNKTWNPVRGCSVISPGCHSCYAMKQAHRFSGPGKPYEGLTKMTERSGAQWTGIVRTVESGLLEPLSWRKPARIFVNSMSDLFHESVPDVFIDRVFAVMALATKHTFQVLTKRPDRMLAYVTKSGRRSSVEWARTEIQERLEETWTKAELLTAYAKTGAEWDAVYRAWPLLNVWLGTSVENQHFADERIPLLLNTPAAVRFVSCEPLLEGIDIAKHRPGALGLHWVIAGGESGGHARPARPEWFRNLLGQCRDAGTAFFMKQLGSNVVTRNDDGWDGDTPRSWPMDTRYDEHVHGYREDFQGADVRVRLRDRKGGDMDEWPVNLRVRDYPETR